MQDLRVGGEDTGEDSRGVRVVQVELQSGLIVGAGNATNEVVAGERDGASPEEFQMDEQSTRVTRWGALHFFAISAQSHTMKTSMPIELAFGDRVHKVSDS